jgi:hypothetical protein
MNALQLSVGLKSKPGKTLASLAQLITTCFAVLLAYFQLWNSGIIFHWTLWLAQDYVMLQSRIQSSLSAMLFQFVNSFQVKNGTEYVPRVNKVMETLRNWGIEFVHVGHIEETLCGNIECSSICWHCVVLVPVHRDCSVWQSAWKNWKIGDCLVLKEDIPVYV